MDMYTCIRRDEYIFNHHMYEHTHVISSMDICTHTHTHTQTVI